MFSQASAPKITGSWGTRAIWRRRSAGSRSRRSTPSKRRAPCLRVVEAQQELEQGGLAAPRRGRPGPPCPPAAIVRDRSLSDRQVRMGRVGEAQILELDPPLGRLGQGPGVRPAARMPGSRWPAVPSAARWRRPRAAVRRRARSGRPRNSPPARHRRGRRRVRRRSAGPPAPRGRRPRGRRRWPRRSGPWRWRPAAALRRARLQGGAEGRLHPLAVARPVDRPRGRRPGRCGWRGAPRPHRPRHRRCGPGWRGTGAAGGSRAARGAGSPGACPAAPVRSGGGW